MSMVQGLRVARVAGVAAGATLALAVAAASRPLEGGSAVGAEVSFRAAVSGELQVEPAAPRSFMASRAFRPGGALRGAFEIRNQTGEAQLISPRLTSSSPELDRVLRVRVESAGRLVADAPLGRLEEAGRVEPIRLASGGSARISVSAIMRPEGTTGWQAALVDVSVRFELEDAPR